MDRPYDDGKWFICHWLASFPYARAHGVRRGHHVFAFERMGPLVGVNLDGHNAHNVFVQTHQAFHFLNRTAGLSVRIIA